MIKFELIITVWEDNQFVMRNRIEADDSNYIREQFEATMDSVEKKLEERDTKKHALEEDDDIPF